MADNLTAPVASGVVVATDEISGVHYQKMKLAFGDSDVATLVSPANALPVSILGTYTSSDPNYTNSQTGGLRLNQKGALITTNDYVGAGDDLNNQVVATMDKPVAAPVYGPSRYMSPDTSRVLHANLKNATGAVQSFRVYNFNTTTGAWFQLHNTNVDPTTNASLLPGGAWYIPAATSATQPGILTISKAELSSIAYCSLGVGFNISTVPNAYTPGSLAASDFFENIAYV